MRLDAPAYEEGPQNSFVGCICQAQAAFCCWFDGPICCGCRSTRPTTPTSCSTSRTLDTRSPSTTIRLVDTSTGRTTKCGAFVEHSSMARVCNRPNVRINLNRFSGNCLCGLGSLYFQIIAWELSNRPPPSPNFRSAVVKGDVSCLAVVVLVYSGVLRVASYLSDTTTQRQTTPQPTSWAVVNWATKITIFKSNTEPSL